MISEKEAEVLLKKIKKNQKAELPVLLQLSEITSISSFSKKLITHRVHISKYQDRYASKRSFYKAITIQCPLRNEK
ncbi:hypothetical protein [Aquimarina sp. 2201CG5-10]|uniref:hypothetical protein n=1 Tax=Aquimarina callyspongiae TaxID=3098150 RepID=UPI002AB49F0A|nr:hypothetical protein [Aquimarina sp. 2201CG5-10]MDY8136436.1 hypothetical protein [Aquimarina sp. 2201CG5-10]